MGFLEDEREGVRTADVVNGDVAEEARLIAQILSDHASDRRQRGEGEGKVG